MSKPTRLHTIGLWLLPVVIVALAWLVFNELLGRLQQPPRPAAPHSTAPQASGE